MWNCQLQRLRLNVESIKILLTIGCIEQIGGIHGWCMVRWLSNYKGKNLIFGMILVIIINDIFVMI